MFGLTTDVEDIRAVSDDGRAELKVVQAEARVPPFRNAFRWEEWDLKSEKRRSILEVIKQ